jgi:phospholipid-binding lipoprotein MlaA
MKSFSHLLRFSLLALAPLLSQCTSTTKKQDASSLASITANTKIKVEAKKQVVVQPAAGDDLNEYAVVEINDPLEGLNRATFWFNDKLYLIVCRPISKGYEAVLPKPVRNGIHNAFENVKFPVRFVNCLLQGKVKRAGQETEKFLLNTVAGVGGLYRMSDKVVSLADLPEEDTGKTLAKWGMGHGAYLVLPFLGPSSVRDGVGLIADYAMNPVYWGYFSPGKHDWTMVPPGVNTLRALPTQLGAYDDAKGEAIDPYIAIRSAYVQFREGSAKK